MAKVLSACLACLILSSSCASIFSKSTYAVNIDSDPQGANFKILNRAGQEIVVSKTPQIVSLKSSEGYFRKEQYEVIYTKENGEEVKLPITFHVDGWYIAGNFIFGGLIGWLIVDPLTGAMFTVDQKRISANLGGETSSAMEAELRVMNLEDYKGDQEMLVRIN